MHPSRKHRIVFVLRMAVFLILGSLALAFLAMELWNWLVPPIIGWKAIDYWQALGLFFLVRILFGFRFGVGRGGHMHWRARMAERWERMSPEEREKFREGMRARGCG